MRRHLLYLLPKVLSGMKGLLILHWQWGSVLCLHAVTQNQLVFDLVALICSGLWALGAGPVEKCVCCAMVSCFPRVRLFVSLWTVTHQAPLSMGFLQARILEWVAVFSSRRNEWGQFRAKLFVRCCWSWTAKGWMRRMGWTSASSWWFMNYLSVVDLTIGPSEFTYA